MLRSAGSCPNTLPQTNSKFTPENGGWETTGRIDTLGRVGKFVFPSFLPGSPSLCSEGMGRMEFFCFFDFNDDSDPPQKKAAFHSHR